MPRLIRGRRVAAESPSPPDLRIEPDERLEALAPRLAGAARIDVHFPKFADGRGFSLARLLRSRYGYQGELRAVGHITRDHLFALAQVGFDAFELREGEDAAEALAAFEEFSVSYRR